MITFILVSVLFISVISGHIALSFPTPRNPDSGLKSHPCGGDNFFGVGQAVTTIQPGPFTLFWGETINHIGAPYRIALSVGDDSGYEDFVLVDHIPHNNPGGGSFSNPKPHQFTVCIPDIDCPQCSLQIIDVMTDKIPTGTCCPYPPPASGYCSSVYHSCANIRINGTQDPTVYLQNHSNPPRMGSTHPYGRESGSWQQDTSGTYVLPNSGSITFDPFFCPTTPSNSQTGISYGSSELLSICGSTNLGGTVINQIDYSDEIVPNVPTETVTGSGMNGGGSTSEIISESSSSREGDPGSKDNTLGEMDIVLITGILVILVPAFCLFLIGGAYYMFAKRKLDSSFQIDNLNDL